MKIKKDVQKCVRMTQGTYDFIMSFGGEGFNDNFDIACNLFKKGRSDLEREIDLYGKLLDDQRNRLSSLKTLKENVDKISRYIAYCEDIVENDMPSLDV